MKKLSLIVALLLTGCSSSITTYTDDNGKPYRVVYEPPVDSTYSIRYKEDGVAVVEKYQKFADTLKLRIEELPSKNQKAEDER